MPRGFKCRRVCTEPENRMFTPEKPCDDMIILAVEELETVRLCDLEGMEQDDAALSMNISRGTLQRILYDARKKIAEALCTGKIIVISGGNYEVSSRPCGCRSQCKICRFENNDRHKEGGENN